MKCAFMCLFFCEKSITTDKYGDRRGRELRNGGLCVQTLRWADDAGGRKKNFFCHKMLPRFLYIWVKAVESRLPEKKTTTNRKIGICLHYWTK